MMNEVCERNNQSQSKIFEIWWWYGCPMRALEAELLDRVRGVIEFASRGNLASDWKGEFFDFDPEAGLYPASVLSFVERAEFLPREVPEKYWAEVFSFLVGKVDPLVREYWARLEDVKRRFCVGDEHVHRDFLFKLDEVQEEVEKRFFGEENFRELVLGKDAFAFHYPRKSVFITTPEKRSEIAARLKKDRLPPFPEALELRLDLPKRESLPPEEGVSAVRVFREGRRFFVELIF